MLSNVVVCRCELGNLCGDTNAGEWPGVQVCFGQADLLMPVQSNAIVYQAALVKLICSCHRGDQWVQAPTISLQPTPLPGLQDRRNFDKRFPVLVMWLSQGRG